MVSILVGIGVFFGVLLVIGFLYFGGVSRREADKLELSRRLGPRDRAGDHEGGPIQIVHTREIDFVGERLGALGRWLHSLILRAGEPQEVGRLVGMCALLGVLGVVGLFVLLRQPTALFGVLLAPLPILWLMRRSTQRSKAIAEQLPDALDLVARALRAGHSFPDALRITSEEMPDPIGVELAHTAEEHRLGIGMKAAMAGLVDRVPNNFEVSMFASAVLVQRETGGNLIEMLEDLADTIRERIVFEGKVRAMTAEVRASSTILQFLPIGAAVALTVVSPTYLYPLFEPGLGRTLLIGAVVMMFSGMLIMRRVADVEI